MARPRENEDTDKDKDTPQLFGAPAPAQRNWKAIAIGIAVIAFAIALAVLFSGGQHSLETNAPGGAVNPDLPSAAAPYAGSLPLTDVKMSSADIGTGAQIYYVTGKVSNTGAQTVTAATVELVFHDAMGNICQRDAEPLQVVVATEPAVDTTDLSRAPLQPGQSRDFQIPIEHISAQWDGQYPTLTIVRVNAK